MKLTLKAIPHISNKIAIDLNKSNLVTFTQGLEPVAKVALDVLEEDVKNELALNEKVSEICEDYEEDIEFMLADERQLFFMIKKKLAPEYDVIIDFEERLQHLSHKILNALYEEDLINYDVTDNKIKNIIFNAISSFIANDNEIHYAVVDKIKSYKKRFIPGTDEYEILYDKLYHEEMQKRGIE